MISSPRNTLTKSPKATELTELTEVHRALVPINAPASGYPHSLCRLVAKPSTCNRSVD